MSETLVANAQLLVNELEDMLTEARQVLAEAHVRNAIQTNAYSEGKGKFITVRGHAVFIPEGKDVGEALTEHFDKIKAKAKEGETHHKEGDHGHEAEPESHDHGGGDHGHEHGEHKHDPLEHLGHEAHTAHELEEIHHGVAAAFGGGAHAVSHVADAHAAHDVAHAAGHAAEAGGHGHHASLADVGAIAARHAYGPALRAVSSILSKVPGARKVAEAITKLHDGATALAEKMTKGMVARYGEATAGAILGAGSVLSHSVTGAVGVHGLAASAIPGPQFIGAIPLLAVAEVGKRLGLVGADSKLEAGVTKVGTWVHAIRGAIGKPLKAAGRAAAAGGLKAAHAAGRAAGAAVRGSQAVRRVVTGNEMELELQLNERGEIIATNALNQGENNDSDEVHEVTFNDTINLSPEEIEQAAKDMMAEFGKEFAKLVGQHAEDLKAAEAEALNQQDVDKDEDK